MIAQLAGNWQIGILAPAIYVVLAVVAHVPIVRKRKQGVLSINQSFTIWLTFTVTMTTLRFMEYIKIINDGAAEGDLFKLGALLDSWHFVPMLSLMAQLQFVFYILRQYKYYSLPIIITFFLSLSLLQYNNPLAYNVMMFPLAYITPILFLFKGLRNRDGFIFSLGLFSLFDYAIPYFAFSSMKYASDITGTWLYVPFLICALISVVVLNLGTWGWLDKHVFYDKAREKQIKNAWVSRLIEIEKKKPDVKKTAGKSVVLECPICHRQGRKQFPHEIVLERARNEKGIVKMLLNQEKEICEHQFVAYVDRAFSIRGYETIDMMA